MTVERVAIITGAGRGMGAATARKLAALGWKLVLVDRAEDDPALTYSLSTREELDLVAAETGAIAVVADVRDQAALNGAVEVAVEEFGGLDAALAVAGCMEGKAAGWETDDDVWAVNIGVNLEGVHRLARAAIPAMLQRPEPRSGRFLAVSSAVRTTGLPCI